jgi:hypothetical protein
MSCAPGVAPCPLPASVPPAPLHEEAGFTVRSCAASDNEVVERTGSRPVTDDDIAKFKERHAHEIITDGINGVGLGGCCRSDPPRLCLVVYAEADTPGAHALLPTLDRLLTADGTPDLQLPVAVYLSGPRRPRCAASDPACGPVSYEHRCAALGSFAHDRAPLDPIDPDPRNTCSADGDCLQSGCGNQCTSYHQGSIAGTCEYSFGLESAWCGCVRGRCAWFK